MRYFFTKILDATFSTNEMKLIYHIFFLQIILGGQASGTIGFECPMQVLKNVGYNFFIEVVHLVEICY